MDRNRTVRQVRAHGGIHRNRSDERTIDGSNFELELSPGLDDFEAAGEAPGLGLDRDLGRHETPGPTAARGPTRTLLEWCAKEPGFFGYDAYSIFANFVFHAYPTGMDRCN